MITLKCKGGFFSVCWKYEGGRFEYVKNMGSVYLFWVLFLGGENTGIHYAGEGHRLYLWATLIKREAFRMYGNSFHCC